MRSATNLPQRGKVLKSHSQRGGPEKLYPDVFSKAQASVSKIFYKFQGIGNKKALHQTVISHVLPALFRQMVDVSERHPEPEQTPQSPAETDGNTDCAKQKVL